MADLSKDLRVFDLHGQHGLGAPIQKMSRPELEVLYPHALGAQEVIPVEFARLHDSTALRDFEERIFYGAELGPYTRARIKDALDPVVFWCRFCRVTLEPLSRGASGFRAKVDAQLHRMRWAKRTAAGGVA